MTELGIVLIGCGGMGRSEARVLADVPQARLVAVCDAYEEAAVEFGREMGVPAYREAAEVFAHPDVEAVIVATPNGMHTQFVLDAAAGGKHIFCEKPLAFTVDECDRMIAAATRHGVRLMVGHVLRLLPLFSRVIELLDAGVVGEPCAAAITRIGWFGDPTARYRLRKETTGGLLYDITVHEIDLLHRLFGPTQMVSATLGRTVLQTIDYEETAHLLLRFRSGATASLFESIASPLSESRGVILATRGALRYNHGLGQITYQRSGEHDDEVRETVAGTDGENGYLRELRSFTAWVLHDTAPLLTAQEGRAAVAVVEAAYASARMGQPVEVSVS